MLIDLRALCNKYKFIPKGVIHIGAHKAEEYEIYDSLGIENVIWIEGNPKTYEELKEVLKDKKNQKAYNYLISDIDDKEYDFKITNNGQSSSILELGKHKTFHPDVFVTEEIKCVSKRVDTIIDLEKIDISNYNFLNLDIQGAELLALKGLSENLKYIDYIYTEINVSEVYKDCALVEQIDEFLSNFGFKRTDTQMTPFEWGDAFYKKNN